VNAQTWTRGALAAAVALALTACASLPSADAGPDRAADREAIEAALYRYTRGTDRVDPDLFTSAFLPDGELLLGATVYKGHEALAGLIEGVATQRAEAAVRGEPPTASFHVTTNESIEFVDDDTAIRRAYRMTLSRTGEGAGATVTVLAAGSTAAELVRLDGEWLIRRVEVSAEP
jgi:hypothetical protein